ncbi:MAG: hypothetical protein DBY04_06190 [Clostridiales bacterium]|nr:MAG: hypothetical protein DBY04_06190 [Clostridiales bacterium]
MNIQLKEATEADLPQLLAICHAAAGTPGSTWHDEYPNAEVLSEDIRGHFLYRIMADGQLIGLIALGPFGELDVLADPSDGPHPHDLARFGIHPAYQGKGLAQKALNAALALCREKEASAVRLLVSPSALPALAIYEKAGFERIRLVHLWDEDYLYLRKAWEQPSEAPTEET